MNASPRDQHHATRRPCGLRHLLPRQPEQHTNHLPVILFVPYLVCLCPAPVHADSLRATANGITFDTADFHLSLKGYTRLQAIAYDSDNRIEIDDMRPVVRGHWRTFGWRCELDLDGDNGRWIHLEGGWYYGPVLMGLDTRMDQLTARVAHAAWNSTGKPQQWHAGGWHTATPQDTRLFPGRWKHAACSSNADFDRDLFTAGDTTFGQSTRECRTFSLMLNWQPARVLRVSAGWVNTIADQGLRDFDGTDRDASYVLQLHVRF